MIHLVILTRFIGAKATEYGFSFHDVHEPFNHFAINVAALFLQPGSQYSDTIKRRFEVVGREYAPATLKHYEPALRHVSSFLKWKYNKPDIDVSEIDHALITSFGFYLSSVRSCNNDQGFFVFASIKLIQVLLFLK